MPKKHGVKRNAITQAARVIKIIDRVATAQ
jgi:hypothetical protein